MKTVHQYRTRANQLAEQFQNHINRVAGFCTDNPKWIPATNSKGKGIEINLQVFRYQHFNRNKEDLPCLIISIKPEKAKNGIDYNYNHIYLTIRSIGASTKVFKLLYDSDPDWGTFCKLLHVRSEAL